MKRKSANYYFQAQFYEATSREVIGSPTTVFTTLQPKVRDHPEGAWEKSYEFVYSFMKKNEMDLTLSTLAVEFEESGGPKIKGIFDKTDHGRFVSDLVQVSQRVRHGSLRDQVHEFVGTQGSV
jgi:hypothetical protein